MSLHVYDTALEVEPVDAADFPEDASGAFVSCFLLAGGLVEAVSLSTERLELLGFRVIDALHCIRVDLEDYEPDEDYPDRNVLLALHGSEYALSAFVTYRAVDDEPTN